MRVLNCIYFEHDYWLVILAALMCVLGSTATMRLVQRMLLEQGAARWGWAFLGAVCSGAAIWSTHFIAMIGYDPGVPMSMDGALTAVSALIAVAGSGLGLAMATSKSRLIASVCGGGTIGLAIAAMHYVGLFAYRAQGIVQWLPEYVIGSIVLAVVLSALAMDRLRADLAGSTGWASGLFVAAIIVLHFTGMAAYSVTPIPGLAASANTEALGALAGAIAMVALLILGTGISTLLVEGHTKVRSQDQLRHLAMHDPLTGLANRRHFNEALQGHCQRLKEAGAPFALLLIDLDRFKPVNDTLGHPIGDKVLQKVANRLQGAVRENDLVARIGGDEFAVIARNLDDGAAACVLAGRIVELLARPFVIDGSPAEIGASVGIALTSIDGTDAESLTIHADMALYNAKRDGRGRYCRFDHTLNEAINHRRMLEADLRQACARDEFHAVYQPIREVVHGRYTGAEALIRWDCPKRGDVPASEFIPIAEELGIISRIVATILRQACREAAGWDIAQSIAVNLSRVQLLDPRLPQIVALALRDAGLPASRLELEITEAALFGNDELALRSLVQMRETGVRITLDHFGTGYASLSYLHRFPFDRVKIDQSFIQRLTTDESSLSLVRAIAQLGLSLGMQVTAEGVETAEQLLTTVQSGCNHVQGSLISRPLDAGQIADLFTQARNKEAA